MPLFPEYTETEGLHRHSGTYGEHGDGILADGLAGAGVLHRHAHENLRLHQGRDIFFRK